MEITLDVINKLDKNDKDYLARQLVIILLNGYYKDNIEIFTDYMLDAWHHEGWGNETMIRDIEELLEDVETVIEENSQLTYKDRNNADQHTHQITVVSIDTDEGVLEPLGVGEMLIEVRY